MTIALAFLAGLGSGIALGALLADAAAWLASVVEE